MAKIDVVFSKNSEAVSCKKLNLDGQTVSIISSMIFYVKKLYSLSGTIEGGVCLGLHIKGQLKKHF